MRRKDREITDLNEMESVIRKADCCHVALSDNDKPYLVALNFGYQPGKPPSLYFHCAREGKKLDILRKNPQACFSVDTDHELVRGEAACGWGMKYRSVSGTGPIAEVTDPYEKKTALDRIMEHYSGKPSHEYDPTELEKTAILKLTVLEISGKKKGY